MTTKKPAYTTTKATPKAKMPVSKQKTITAKPKVVSKTAPKVKTTSKKDMCQC